MRRTLTTMTAVAALCAATVPAISWSAPATVPAPSAVDALADASDPGVKHASKGTGVLPNFAAEGDNLVRLQIGAFDPMVDAAPIQAGVAAVDAAAFDRDVARYWLVQVADGRYADALQTIDAEGGWVAQYLPETTYVVRATPAQREAIDASSAIRWTGYYQPAYKLAVAAGGRQGMLDLTGIQQIRVHGFPGAPDMAALGAQLAAIDGVSVTSDSTTVVDVMADVALLPSIAAIEQASWVVTKPVAVPLNAEARWVNDTGVRDLYDATVPLTGAGQTASAADSGLNYTIDLNGQAHIDFRDCDPYPTNCKAASYTLATPGDNSVAGMNAVTANSTNHRKMVAFFDLGGNQASPRDDSAHGSHVSGSITADTNGDGLPDGHDGIAPGANYVFQSVGTPTGGLGGLPGDNYDLYRQAYRPSNPADVPSAYAPADYAKYEPLEDARTHNYSIGLIVNTVDAGDAYALDRFAWEHEDFVTVVSAGNEGPDPASIGSPSVAKNNLSSAASANGRQPMASIDSIASFSSHGPTGDGRIGPDLATPGQTIISTKGGSADEHHYLQGTSMSAPILTGLATLVRQYFWDGYGPADGEGFAGGAPDGARQHNASAALVKAALVNGAVRMRGYYSGDDGNTRQSDGQWPSWGQGFGLVNLSNSLHFTGDTKNNWFRDVWRSNADAFAPTNQTNPPNVTRSYTIDVAAGQPLDVTLSWTDAPTALIAGTPALVNDLNLRVVGPDGEYIGNNFNSRSNPAVDVAETPAGPFAPDTKNPTERIRVAAPTPGTYTIEVSAGRIQAAAPQVGGGKQGFALAASGNISVVDGSFTPGPELQSDIGFEPEIDTESITVENISTDTTMVRFSTDEPTTASVTVDGTEYHDVYNRAPGDGFVTAYDAGTVETSAAYAGRRVVGTEHEVLVFGLDPGADYTMQLNAVDLGSNAADPVDIDFTNTQTALQPQASDMALLVEASPPPAWKTSTQMYVGPNGGTEYMGAFGFEIPDGVAEETIIGAVLELTGMHDLSPAYDADPTLHVNLMSDTVDGDWGGSTSTFETVTAAAVDVRLSPDTKNIEGGQAVHAFTFRCTDLDALKVNMNNGFAAFTVRSEVEASTSLPSYEIGFNRRSRGPTFRPRLVLLTESTPSPATGPCDPDTPAPTISEVAISPRLEGTASTVHWTTDVPSDSLVIFREQGTEDWTQVGSPALTKLHQIQVGGLDPDKDYEFGVRSTACNGASTTDDNAGAGWDFGYIDTSNVPVNEYFFIGTPNDEANKPLVFGTGVPSSSASMRVDPIGPTDPGGQQKSALGNPDYIGNPIEAYWYAPTWSTPLNGRIDVTFTLTGDPTLAGLIVGVFTDVYGIVDEGTRIGGGVIPVSGAGAGPIDVTGSITLDGEVGTGLLIQVAPDDIGQEITLTYGNLGSPNAGFSAPVDPLPPSPTDGLPLTGTVPPPSAGGTALDIASVPTRLLANEADRAAGTGVGCFAPAALPPLAVDDVASTGVDTPVNIPVLDNDSDPNGDDLTITDITPSAASATVELNVDGETIDYTPRAGFEGTDYFQYTIDDGNGGTDTATVTVRVSDGPVVTEVSTSCAIYGQQLTITGFAFGASQGSSYPVLGGEPIGPSNVVSWSDTQVVVTVPSDHPSGYAGVVVAGQTSNGKYVETAAADDPDAGPPSLASMSPDSGGAGDTVTFTGTGFGDVMGCGEAVAFAGTYYRDASLVQSWSDTEVVVTVPDGVSSGYAGLEVNGVTSNGRYFSVGDPAHVDSVAPNPVAGGQDITITGTNFGASQGSSTAILAGASIAVVSWSDTEVVATVPAEAGSGYVGIVRDGAASNGIFLYVDNGEIPSVASISPQSGPVGTTVTISGSNFGATQGGSYVVFNGQQQSTVVSWSDTSIQVEVPSGATDGYVGVVRSGNTSNGKYFDVTGA